MTTGAASWLEGALTGPSEELVPLIVLHDGSSFGVSFAKEFAALATGLAAKVTLSAEWPEADEAFSCVARADFRTHIHPARLWEGQKPWVVVVADVASSDTRAQIASLLQAWAGRYRLLPFLLGDLSGGEWRALLDAINLPGQTMFLQTPLGFIARSEDLVARGCAAYACTCWNEYSRRKDGNWREALALVGEGHVFSIGMAAEEPDWAFHGHAWKDKTLRELALPWSTQGGSAERPDYPTAAATAGRFCPSSNYRAREEEDERAGALLTGQRAVSMRFVQTPVLPGFRSPQAVDELATRVQRLRKFREFLFLSERQTAERLLVRQSRSWLTHMREALVRSMVFPANAIGCLRWMRSLLEHWLWFVGTQQGVRLRPPKGLRTFEDNLVRLQRREADRPRLSSGLLRFVLLATGTFWTVWGTFFWATRAHVWNDPGMRKVFLVSSGGLVALLAAVVGQALLMQWACHRAERFAREDLLADFLHGLMERVRLLLQERARELRDLLELWKDSLDKLTDWVERVASGGEALLSAPPANRNARFEPGALAVLHTEALPGLLERIHKAVARRISEDARWPFFELAVWRDVVQAEVAREVDAYLAAISYDAAVASSRWDAARRRHLIEDLAADARRPAYPSHPVPHARVSLLASQGWKTETAGDASLRLTGQGLPSMLAVSAVPLPDPGPVLEGA